MNFQQKPEDDGGRAQAHFEAQNEWGSQCLSHHNFITTWYENSVCIHAYKATGTDPGRMVSTCPQAQVSKSGQAARGSAADGWLDWREEDGQQLQQGADAQAETYGLVLVRWQELGASEAEENHQSKLIAVFIKRTFWKKSVLWAPGGAQQY